MALNIMKICLAFEENTQDVQLVDSELYEGRAIVKEMDEAITDVDKLSKETEANEKIVDILGSNDNVSVEAIQLAEINLSSLRRKLNYQSSNVSVESVRNLKIALEEEKGILGRIWDMIKAVFKWIGEKISQFVNWVKGLFGGGKPKKAEEAIQKAADAKISLNVAPVTPTTAHKAASGTGEVKKTQVTVTSPELEKKTVEAVKAVKENLEESGKHSTTVQLGDQNVEVTKANAEASVKAAVETTAISEITKEQIDSLRILAEHKEDFIGQIKAIDLKEYSSFKDCFVNFINKITEVCNGVDVNKVISDVAGMNRNQTRSYIEGVFDIIISPEKFAKFFNNFKNQGDDRHTNIVVGDYYLYVGIALNDLRDGYINTHTRLDHYLQTVKQTPDEPFKIMDSDIKYLANETAKINAVMQKEVTGIQKSLILDDVSKGISIALSKLSDNLDTAFENLPEGSPSREPLSLIITMVTSFTGKIVGFIKYVSVWWKKIAYDTIGEFRHAAEFVMVAAQALHKAERRNEDTIEWLTKLCNSKT